MSINLDQSVISESELAFRLRVPIGMIREHRKSGKLRAISLSIPPTDNPAVFRGSDVRFWLNALAREQGNDILDEP